MATGKNTVCTPSNGTSSRLLPFISHCSDSFTAWRTVFIKQERSPTHRTLHETFGARHPSSVTPLTGRASFPPGEAKGSRYVFARDFIKTRVPTAKPLSQAPWACQLPFQGRFSRCPPWGWCSAQRIKIVMIAGGNHTSVSCREAAKGVPSVFLSCCHSSNNTPSVSLCSTAPPLGSQGPEPFRGAKGKSSQIRLYFLSRL